ncbi:MAG TPA: MarR family transcriptional regulator [Propionicimonas sp.]|nr:MarR family transcriptional regulator [Propionicimonas sp.]HRA07512.1 MarR family transcriptional regulator [Propionicimonas sp.]
MDSLIALAADLRIACQRVSRRVRFESGDLAPHLVSAMANLRHGPVTPGELAEVERISAPSMTRTVNCLVDRGLVAREDHPSDGRCKVLTLTASGHDVLDEVARARNDWMVHQLEGLSVAERLLLREAADLLNRVVAQ